MMFRGAFVASMAAFATPLTVPTQHVSALMTRLSRAGFLVLDTGERVSTEDGMGAEALLHLVEMPLPEAPDAFPLGVSP